MKVSLYFKLSTQLPGKIILIYKMIFVDYDTDSANIILIENSVRLFTINLTLQCFSLVIYMPHWAPAENLYVYRKIPYLQDQSP